MYVLMVVKRIEARWHVCRGHVNHGPPTELTARCKARSEHATAQSARGAAQLTRHSREARAAVGVGTRLSRRVFRGNPNRRSPDISDFDYEQIVLSL